MAKDEWVRVESESEVKVGMALKWRAVGDIAIVLGFGPAQVCGDCGADGQGTRLTDDPDWYAEEDQWNCITCDVSVGDLYRLRDLPLETSEVRKKELTSG